MSIKIISEQDGKVMSEVFDIIRVVTIVAVLILASVSDLRTREVSDRHWIVLAAIGTICMLYASSDAGVRKEHIMMIIGTIMIALSVFVDLERKRTIAVLFYMTMILLFAVPMMTAWDDPLVRQFAIIPITFLLFLGLYFTGILKGGADVKCMITLTMVMQTYPHFYGSPLISVPTEMSSIFPFPIAVLFHAALFSILVVFFNLHRNIRNGDGLSMIALTGYNVPAEEAERTHVWKIGDEDDAGMVRVSPMIPFIVPITAAVLFVSVIGNLMFIPF